MNDSLFRRAVCGAAAAALALCVPATAGAQEGDARAGGARADADTASVRTTTDGPRSKLLTVSYAPTAHLRTREGIRSRDVFQMAFRTAWRSVRTEPVQVDLTVDVVPLSMTTDSPVDTYWVSCDNGRATCERLRHATLYGAGVMPVGLQMVANPAGRVRMTASMGMGLIVFTRAFPDPSARRVNFLGEAGAGLEVGARGARGAGIAFGYRQQHVSNAGTADVNPGANAGMFYAGVVWR